MGSDEIYNKIPLQKIEIEDVKIGLRQIGNGKDVVFLHGFPTHGYTWRKIIPKLSEHFKCHILDLPGLGDSEWSDETNFESSSQAKYVIKMLEQLKIDSYSIIAHNSGATIGRIIAIQESNKVANLIMMNTEIPDHRPPWIPFYQKLGLMPLVPRIIRILLTQNWFIKSSIGFKELYADKSMLKEEENILPYTKPIISSQNKTKGAFKYLKGIEWKLVDDFKYSHRKIKANTLIIWGEKDKTFPIALGKQMVKQFNVEIEFKTIADASLLPHEEKPKKVISAILKFMKKEYANQ